MRVLTVRQPWAWAIVHGGKTVENRSRNLAGDYRGLVAIHAALKGAEDDACVPVWGKWLDSQDDDVRGAIIGVVDLVGVHHFAECVSLRTTWQSADPDDDRIEQEVAKCSPWAEEDRWHLELANPRPLPELIPFRGALGLRELPAEVEQALFFRRRHVEGVR